MRAFLICVVVAGSVSSAVATEHESWNAYIKANRYACPGPLDTLKAPRTVTLGNKTYEHTGYKLTVKNPDQDAATKLGVLSAVKDVTEGTKQNLRDSFAWFTKQGVEWVVVTGDLALEELDLEEVIDQLAAPGLPLLLILGNSESKGSFARAYKDRVDKYPHLINGVWLRQVVADDVEFWTLPGYHDRRFVHQGAGCLYQPEDLTTMTNQLQPSGSGPVMLVAHGPPRGRGKHAMDWIQEKRNVGDPALTEFLKKKALAFGLFGHILEAGGAAVGADLSTPVKAGQPVTALHLNAGSISGDAWGMNDGTTSTGMAFVISIEGTRASYEVRRFDPPAAVE